MSGSLKILALTRYSGLAASSRLRTFQFSPFLASDGIRVDAYPLLSERYLDKLYGGHGHALVPAFSDYIARLMNRFRFSGYDAWVTRFRSRALKQGIGGRVFDAALGRAAQHGQQHDQQGNHAQQAQFLHPGPPPKGCHGRRKIVL